MAGDPVTVGIFIAICARLDRELDTARAVVDAASLRLTDALTLLQQHPAAKVKFQGNAESQFVVLDGSFSKEAIREILSCFDIPLDVRTRIKNRGGP